MPCKVAQNVRISEAGSFREVEEPWMKQGLGWGNTGVDGWSGAERGQSHLSSWVPLSPRRRPGQERRMNNERFIVTNMIRLFSASFLSGVCW